MKGFKLIINDHSFSGGVADGILAIIITAAHDQTVIDFLGNDHVDQKQFVWAKNLPFKLGDILTVAYVDIDSNSTPLAISDMVPPEDNRLKEFKRLSTRLHEKGLI